jgi:hypothetical protein
MGGIMPENRYFWCANKACDNFTCQPIEKSKQELDDCKLCKLCYDKGYRLKLGPTVIKLSRKEIEKERLTDEKAKGNS